MDKKQALELVNQMIEENKRNDIKSALNDFVTEFRARHFAPLTKAIKDVEEDMKKIDPTTKLPGTLLDKQMGDMQSNLNPGAGADASSGIVKADPATAAPMLGSEGKKDWKGFMQKCMKTLTASEKGVHKPHFMAGKKTGTSDVGARMVPGGASKKTNEWAKGQHKEKLSELQSMPKPNLPKSESEPVEKGAERMGAGKHGLPKQHEKGVHQPPSQMSYDMNISNNPGESIAGFHAQMGAARNGRSASPQFASNARQMHTKKLAELQSMPKPNLPKTEKAEGAPALGGTGTGAPSTPVARPNKGFGAIVVKQEMQKDDKPHPAGSPEERSHAVAEGMASLPKAAAQMNAKGHEATQRFFNHLRTLKDKSKMRSPENVMTQKSEEKPENQKDMSKDAKSAIMESADKPMKVQENRPGQANKPS